MDLSIIGELVKILPEQSGESARGTWKKCNFIIKTREKYSKSICIVAWGDKINDLNVFKPGDIVNVHFNLESREYNERWYTDVKMWKIDSGSIAEDQIQPQDQTQNQQNQAILHPADSNLQAPPEDNSDDLPF